jgi:hypothetical protein
MNKIIATIIIIMVVLGSYYLMKQSISAPEGEIPSEGEENIKKECTDDDSCVVFGQDGDCNCGCYNKGDLPTETGGECFCAVPDSCKCVDKKCEGVFEDNQEDISNFKECVEAGYSILGTYPLQCRSENQTFTEEHCVDKDTQNILSLADARQIAIESECGDRLEDTYFCNENTGTYWIDLNIEKQGCNPACVIDITTREGVINWRSTGLMQ